MQPQSIATRTNSPPGSGIWTGLPGRLAFAALATLCCTAAPTNSAAAASGESVIVQAHRGAGNLAPENTLEAFELGWKLGAIPEADLRTTKDGVIVAFHDANFKRVVKGASPELQKKGVADISFAEL